MRSIEPGHIYMIEIYDRPEGITQAEMDLPFLKRVGPRYPGNQEPPHMGTNCQELIRVLIDRTEYLNGQEEDWRNVSALQSLRYTLMCFESRAAERAGRPFPVLISQIEKYPTCPDCGHIRLLNYPHAKCPSGGLRG